MCLCSTQPRQHSLHQATTWACTGCTVKSSNWHHDGHEAKFPVLITIVFSYQHLEMRQITQSTTSMLLMSWLSSPSLIVGGYTSAHLYTGSQPLGMNLTQTQGCGSWCRIMIDVGTGMFQWSTLTQLYVEHIYAPYLTNPSSPVH